jgi:hypothetical protein
VKDRICLVVLLDEIFIIFTVDECAFERGPECGWLGLVKRRCLKKCSKAKRLKIYNEVI